MLLLAAALAVVGTIWIVARWSPRAYLRNDTNETMTQVRWEVVSGQRSSSGACASLAPGECVEVCRGIREDFSVRWEAIAAGQQRRAESTDFHLGAFARGYALIK
ncbi:MAG TPA: hypothetical protein VF384_17260 [Planctomycetota bacterium]